MQLEKQAKRKMQVTAGAHDFLEEPESFAFISPAALNGNQFRNQFLLESHPTLPICLSPAQTLTASCRTRGPQRVKDRGSGSSSPSGPEATKESSVERRKVVQRLFPARTPVILNMSRIRNTLPPACQENHLTPGDTDLVPQRLLDNQAEKESEAGVDLKRDEEDVPLCEDVELQDRDLSPEEKIFLKEFPRLKADIEGNINKLRALAEDVDKTHKKFTKANIVVNSTGVICEAMSLLGFAFAPVTGGVSLLLSTTGQGLAAAAGLTSIVSGMEAPEGRSKDKVCGRVESQGLGAGEETHLTHRVLQELATERWYRAVYSLRPITRSLQCLSAATDSSRDLRRMEQQKLLQLELSKKEKTY
ncbi:apolipoprotein L6 isoform X7 [Trachypithecus francoisi]|uniref:apolipoprotein L6 isoform X7 n=1 Tax=Trachypithecus francoisi TaxID=54180 RepID=UPI00141B1527|nr:apolipoprotein L6 isoform X7 [Trachypithecus francoisi]